ncbi:MAG TPA: ATP-sensitive inward rectifier potassium channel 10 [Rhodospirillaceae bacterium]|nr:ATP-sensitive inward rectifier potassium channel 10 [Rhodospirillaceae bacterium]
MKKERRKFIRHKDALHKKSAQDAASYKEEQVHRFIARDGRVNIKKHGLSHYRIFDWNHFLLNATLFRLLLSAGLYFVAVNAFFGGLYLLDESGIDTARPHNFFDHFFFSVHVFSTLGFNDLNSQSLYANILVTIESFVGWCSFGLITGLLFSRFSRPSSRVMFTHYAAVSLFEGIPTLIFRAANRRGNQILQAQISASLARNEMTLEGEKVRRIYDLKLLRSTSSFFNLTWTIRHSIDASSPLFGETEKSLRESQTEIVVLLSGIDDTFGQTVHGRFAYNYEEIVFGYRFVSLFGRDKNNHPIIDFSKFDEIKEAPLIAKE